MLQPRLSEFCPWRCACRRPAIVEKGSEIPFVDADCAAATADPMADKFTPINE
jgi:hypothetical protein